MFAWIVYYILDVREIIFGNRFTTKSDVRRPISADPLISSLSCHQVLRDWEFIQLILLLYPLFWLFLIQMHLRYLYKWVICMFLWLGFINCQLRIYIYLVLRLEVTRRAMVLPLKSSPILIGLLPSDGLSRDAHRIVVQGQTRLIEIIWGIIRLQKLSRSDL